MKVGEKIACWVAMRILDIIFAWDAVISAILFIKKAIKRIREWVSLVF